LLSPSGNTFFQSGKIKKLFFNTYRVNFSHLRKKFQFLMVKTIFLRIFSNKYTSFQDLLGTPCWSAISFNVFFTSPCNFPPRLSDGIRRLNSLTARIIGLRYSFPRKLWRFSFFYLLLHFHHRSYLFSDFFVLVIFCVVFHAFWASLEWKIARRWKQIIKNYTKIMESSQTYDNNKLHKNYFYQQN